MAVSYLPEATIPDKDPDLPLPGTDSFARVAGRSGDILVYQLKSGIGAPQDQRDALRTLGLKGPSTASLRNSRSNIDRGLIRKVRSYIAVIDLHGVSYKHGKPIVRAPELEIERPKYGTSTSPGELTRDQFGNYFGYETGRAGTLVYWSTPLGLDEFLYKLPELPEVSILPSAVCQILPNSPEAGVMNTADGWEVTLESLRSDIILQQKAGAVIVAMDNNDTELIWHAPYERFHDRDSVSAELSMFFTRYNPLALRALLAASGDPGLMGAVDVDLIVRDNGKLKPRTLRVFDMPA